MGIMVYSLLWVMQDFVHQPYETLGDSTLKQAMVQNLQRDLHASFLGMIQGMFLIHPYIKQNRVMSYHSIFTEGFWSLWVRVGLHTCVSCVLLFL